MESKGIGPLQDGSGGLRSGLVSQVPSYPYRTKVKYNREYFYLQFLVFSTCLEFWLPRYLLRGARSQLSFPGPSVVHSKLLDDVGGSGSSLGFLSPLWPLTS